MIRMQADKDIWCSATPARPGRGRILVFILLETLDAELRGVVFLVVEIDV